MSAESCRFCGNSSVSSAKCCGVRYCREACQKLDWPLHKLRCPATLQLTRRVDEVTCETGLRIYLHTINCYRLRLYDRFTLCGDESGIYAPDPTRWEIVTDFLVFARLLVPVSEFLRWNWDDFLQSAAAMLSIPVDDASMLRIAGSAAGVRTLRDRATAVYGFGVEEDTTPAHAALVSAIVHGGHSCSAAWFADTGLFDEVGLAAAWYNLLNAIPSTRHGSPDASTITRVTPDVQGCLLAELQQSKRRLGLDGLSRMLGSPGEGGSGPVLS
jgi:hypothetical protein